MKVAVLGAGGFIGSHLVEHLLHQTDHQVLGVDVTDEKLANVDTTGMTFHLGDVTKSPELLEEAVASSDCVVNLVAYANPSLYVTEPIQVVDLNLHGNLLVVDACRRHKRRIIQFSSAEIYGKPREGETAFIEDETDFTYGPVHRQRWIYANAKQMLERILFAYGTSGELAFSVIRPFNVIGPRLDYLVPAGTLGGPRVFMHFMSALLSGGPIHLVDSGTATRSFTHANDAARGITAILEQPERANNQAFNIGNPSNNLTIRELADRMIRIYEKLTGTRSECEIINISGETFYGEGYDDAGRHPPSIEKMAGLGWTPKYDLDTTLTMTIEHHLQHADTSKAANAS
ncbi:NAD-dependent epimerase/dehydratase family protein [Phycisphaerales bacterium AB-hyl4]|uniref:NAD-dependent epimerase/dehydratase family protein n=1 Tax=Natronomicrosphaera hydrolytica TaxID=3242702 RepID=A0ABV4U3U3_9BACT